MDLVFRGGGSENAGIHPAAQKSLGKEPGDSALGTDEPEGTAALAAMVDLAPQGATWGSCWETPVVLICSYDCHSGSEATLSTPHRGRS